MIITQTNHMDTQALHFDINSCSKFAFCFNHLAKGNLLKISFSANTGTLTVRPINVH